MSARTIISTGMAVALLCGATHDTNADIWMKGSGADADQTIYFQDSAVTTTNYIRWDDLRTDICAPTADIDSAFVWNITDNVDSGWIFTNGTDPEFHLDNIGNLGLDGSVTEFDSCDLAETFFAVETLEPGTVVSLDVNLPEGVRSATSAYDDTVVGVVSTKPGFLMGGPRADAYPFIRERLTLQQGNTDDPTVAQRLQELEEILDNWPRGDVNVALAGRVPVKVDASYGSIEPGDPLTSSPTPGHAMKATRPGTIIGMALSGLESGQGEVLVFPSLRYHVPHGYPSGAVEAGELTTRQEDRIAALEQENARLKERLAEIEAVLKQLAAR